MNKTNIKSIPTLPYQITRSYSAAFTAFIIITFALLYLIVGSLLDQKIDEDLEEDFEEYQMLLTTKGLEALKEEIIREADTGDTEEFFIQLLNEDGNAVVSSPMDKWKSAELSITTNSNEYHNLKKAYADSIEDHSYTLFDLKQQMINTRALYGALNDTYYLYMGESKTTKQEIMTTIFLTMLLLLLVLLPCIIWFGWKIAKKATIEISEISAIAKRINHKNLNELVRITPSSTEVADLTYSFNNMLGRIFNLVNEMKTLTDNVAHDLRSPLARIRAIAESSLSRDEQTRAESINILKSNAAKTIEECDRLLQMVNLNLDISEMESGTSSVQFAPTDLSSIVSEAFDLFDIVADQKGIDFSCTTKENIFVLGDIQSLQRMFANLIDNAIKYTEDSGIIAIELFKSSDFATVKVTDNGVGIPLEAREKIFERFFRCDQSRSQDGCGLGLSYARAVTRLHKGQIRVEANYPSGSIFTVTLPLLSLSTPPANLTNS